MMIDIFQYSNMYTLRKNIQWMADAPHVTEECGPYVVRPGSDAFYPFQWKEADEMQFRPDSSRLAAAFTPLFKAEGRKNSR